MNRVKLRSLLGIFRGAKHYSQKLLSVLSLLMASAVLLTPFSAQAISGGTGSSLPWLVQVLEVKGDKIVYSCTGSAISANLILTAAHCPAHRVLYPSGAYVTVASAHPVAGTDIQVVVLGKDVQLSEYPTLGPNYIAGKRPILAGTMGKAYGYGRLKEGAASPQKSINVRLVNHGTISDGQNDAFHVTSRTGATEQGDSGGPLIINNLLVGILHGGEVDFDNGQQISEFHGLATALSVVRQLQHTRELRSADVRVDVSTPWISAVKVENNAVSITMSDELINSGQQVVVWVNGRYLGEVKGNQAYYAYKETIPGGAIYRMGGFLVRDSDIIQVGIVTGANNPDASTLLYESVPSGIQAVNIDNGKLSVTTSSHLINSGHKIAFWVNGQYTGEVQNNRAYYASKQDIDSASILTFTNSTTHYGDLIQIGIITHTNAPGASVLLYSGRPSGIERVDFNNNHFDVKMNPAMFNAPQRFIIWVDGGYCAELYKGTQYYGAHMPILDGNLYHVPSARASATSTIQIGVVPGVPGDSVGTPDTAKILYSK